MTVAGPVTRGKVRILLSQLGLPYERVTLDLARGDAHQPVFRKLSRFARVPVLQLENGQTMVESAAILIYLAQGAPFLPTIPMAVRTSWLFFEQADLQEARGLASDRQQVIQRLHAEGHPPLERLDQWLQGRTWLVGERYTIADTAVFVYVSLAVEGGYDLERFAAIREWIGRVRSQPAWVQLAPDAR